VSWIPPLLVAIPLLSAAAIAGLDHVTPQPVQDALVVAASAATTALAFVLLRPAVARRAISWRCITSDSNTRAMTISSTESLTGLIRK